MTSDLIAVAMAIIGLFGATQGSPILGVIGVAALCQVFDHGMTFLFSSL